MGTSVKGPHDKYPELSSDGELKTQEAHNKFFDAVDHNLSFGDRVSKKNNAGTSWRSDLPHTSRKNLPKDYKSRIVGYGSNSIDFGAKDAPEESWLGEINKDRDNYKSKKAGYTLTDVTKPKEGAKKSNFMTVNPTKRNVGGGLVVAGMSAFGIHKLVQKFKTSRANVDAQVPVGESESTGNPKLKKGLKIGGGVVGGLAGMAALVFGASKAKQYRDSKKDA